MSARQKMLIHQHKERTEKKTFRGMKKMMTRLLPKIVKQTIVTLREQESSTSNEIESQGGDATRTMCKQCGEYHPGWICYKDPEECFECGGTGCKIQECKNPRKNYENWNDLTEQRGYSSDCETESQTLELEAVARKELKDWYDSEMIKQETKARDELYRFVDSDMINHEANFCFLYEGMGHTSSDCENTSGYSQYKKAMSAEANQNQQYDLQQQY